MPRRRRPYLLAFLCAGRKLGFLFAPQSRRLPRLFLSSGQGCPRPASKLFRRSVHASDRDRILPPSGSGESLAKPLSGLRANLKPALGFEDLDGADVAFGDAASLANQRQNPPRLGALLASGRELEPDAIFKIAAGRLRSFGISSRIHELFRRRPLSLILAKECGCDFLRAFRRQLYFGEANLLIGKRARKHRVAQKTLPVELEYGLGARNRHPRCLDASYG